MPLGSIAYATAEQMHARRGTDSAHPRVRQARQVQAGRLPGRRLRESRIAARAEHESHGASRKRRPPALMQAVNRTAPNDSETARRRCPGGPDQRRARSTPTPSGLRSRRRLAGAAPRDGRAGWQRARALTTTSRNRSDRRRPRRSARRRSATRRCAGTSAARRGTSGCGPIRAMLSDRDSTSHSRRSTPWAISARGRGADGAARSPSARRPPVGSWHRDTHAFVALAKRSPESGGDVDGSVRRPSGVVGADVRRRAPRRLPAIWSVSRSSPQTRTTTSAKRRSGRCAG